MAALLWPAYIGMYCKLLAMTVLSLTAIAAGVAEAKALAEQDATADRHANEGFSRFSASSARAGY